MLDAPLSKDSDFSLVSTANLSQTIPSNSWGPGHDELGQKCLNLPHLWCHLQKNLKCTTYIFQCNLEDLLYFLRAWTAL